MADPAYASEPFGEALARLLDEHGMSAARAVEQLGKRWRHTLDRLPSVDRRQLPPDHLREVRELFRLPAGYFAEERLERVIDQVSSDGALRDAVYFGLVNGRSDVDAVVAAQMVAEGGPADAADAIPVAPPTFKELAVVVVDISERAGGRADAPPPARRAIAHLITQVAASSLRTGITIAFVTVNEAGVASTPPVPPDELGGESFLDAIWSSGADLPADPESPRAPKLADALDAARSQAEAFLDHPHDVPAAAVVLVLASGAAGDPDRARAAAAGIHALPFTKVVTYHLADADAESPEAALLHDIATHAEHAPLSVHDVPLADWLLHDRFVSA